MKNFPVTDEDSDDEGSGGISGKIEFRFQDAAFLPPRDDILPQPEINRLLVVQSDLHKANVDKQKETRKNRAALKEGKKPTLTAAQNQAYGLRGGISKYKKHPITLKAYFSGMDKQVITLPTELENVTNLKMEEKLELRFAHRHVPKSTPRLTRGS